MITENSKFIARRLATAKIVSVKQRTFDSDGKMTYAGVVTFENHFGSTCIMTVGQFEEIYLPLDGFIKENKSDGCKWFETSVHTND